MTKQIVLFFILIFLACGKSKQTETIDVASLTPFEMTIGTDSNITVEDRQKLANAKGREVSIIDIITLEEYIQDAENRIHIFHFWSLSDNNSLNMNLALERINLQLNVEIVLINIDNINLQKSVNAYLRTEGITTKVYQLENPKEWSQRIEETWNGELPYLLMVQQEQETFLPYQQVFSYEMLYAILQPLL